MRDTTRLNRHSHTKTARRVAAALVVTAIVGAVAGVADDAPPNGAGVPDDAEATPLHQHFTVRIASVNMQRSVRFDDAGEVEREDLRTDIRLKVAYDADAVTPLEMCAKLERVMTTAGEHILEEGRWRNHKGEPRFRKLHIVDQMNQFEELAQHGFDVPDREPSFDALVRCRYPRLHAERIEIIEGELIVRAQVGELNRQSFGPLSDLDGRKIELDPDDDELGPIAIRVRPNEIQLDMNARAADALQDIAFEDASGKRLSVRSTRSTTMNNHATQKYGVVVPDDGRMIIRRADNVKEITIPVRIERIPLPEVPKAEGVAAAR